VVALLLVLVSACVAPRPGSVPLPRRVAEILARRHITPPASQGELSSRLFDRARDLLGCQGAASTRLGAERSRVLAALLAGDFRFAARAAADCRREPPAPALALELMLNALAAAYDPHSRYLAPAALQRFQTQTAASGSDRVAHGVLIEWTGHRLGVLSLPAIYWRARQSASADLRRLITQLSAERAEVLLLDLRGNGGGVLKEAARVFGVFAGPGPLAQLRRRDQPPELLEAPKQAAASALPLVVCIDAGTASVAELLAAALQDSGRALLIGQRSYGKGLAQTLVLLGSPRDLGDGAVDVSERRFYRLDGRPLQREGVTPDVLYPGGSEMSERSLPGALAPDEIAPAPVPFSAQPSRPAVESSAVRAVTSYLESEAASAK
jgi:hypothetical protein